jgi:hypothetical protein
LTQFTKWAGIDDRRGPLAVILLSLLGVLLWSFSTVPAWDRSLVWSIFSGWVNVLLTAAGIYGFTRALPQAVSSFTVPPGQGAGSEPVASMSAAGHEDELIPMTDDEREEILAATRALGPAEVARVLGMLRARHESYARTVGATANEPLDDEGTGRRD